MVTIKASKFRTDMLKPYTSEINVEEKNDLCGFEIVAVIDGDDNWATKQRYNPKKRIIAPDFEKGVKKPGVKTGLGFEPGMAKR